MARKTRKQKMKFKKNIALVAPVAQQAQPIEPARTGKVSVQAAVTAMQATQTPYEIAVTGATKRDIFKTLIIIFCISLVQAAIFFAKKQGLLAF